MSDQIVNVVRACRVWAGPVGSRCVPISIFRRSAVVRPAIIAEYIVAVVSVFAWACGRRRARGCSWTRYWFCSLGAHSSQLERKETCEANKNLIYRRISLKLTGDHKSLKESYVHLHLRMVKREKFHEEENFWLDREKFGWGGREGKKRKTGAATNSTRCYVKAQRRALSPKWTTFKQYPSTLTENSPALKRNLDVSTQEQEH